MVPFDTINKMRVESPVSRGVYFLKFDLINTGPPNKGLSKKAMIDSEYPSIYAQASVEFHSETHKQRVLYPPRPSTLYVISNGQGYFKIGITSKSGIERAAELQTGSPYKLEVAYEFLVDSNFALSYESYLHQRFANVRAEGEWFKLSPDDFNWFNQPVLPVIFAPIFLGAYAMPDEYFPEGCKDIPSPVDDLARSKIKERRQ